TTPAPRTASPSPTRTRSTPTSCRSCAAEPGRPPLPGTREESPMNIVVIGGSGLIGSKLVAALRSHGHETTSASPDSGVDTLTGEGLSRALTGADTVVDVSNSPSFEEAAVMEFFETSTRNLLEAEAIAR